MNTRNVQDERVGHLEVQGASRSFDPPRSSSTTNAGTSSSLFGALCSQSGDQNGCPVTLSAHEHADVAAQSPTVAQGQHPITQASQRRQQKAQEKKEKDRIKKAADRASDDRAYSRVCQLLAVKSGPKNTRSKRSECLYIHNTGGIERYVVLQDVESIDQNFESVCELLEISMTPRKPLALRREYLHIRVLFRRRYLSVP
jgi:hypothetical protein